MTPEENAEALFDKLKEHEESKLREEQFKLKYKLSNYMLAKGLELVVSQISLSFYQALNPNKIGG